MTPTLTPEKAATAINNHFGLTIDGRSLHYQTAKEIYPNTAGPFSYAGCIAGRALTVFTIEAYSSSDGHACIFCNGKIIEFVDKFNTLENLDLMKLGSKSK